MDPRNVDADLIGMNLPITQIVQIKVAAQIVTGIPQELGVNQYNFIVIKFKKLQLEVLNDGSTVMVKLIFVSSINWLCSRIRVYVTKIIADFFRNCIFLQN